VTTEVREGTGGASIWLREIGADDLDARDTARTWTGQRFRNCPISLLKPLGVLSPDVIGCVPVSVDETEIEAWANGPVVRALYHAHRGKYRVSRLPGGEADALTDEQRETVDAVLEFYGDKSPQWLSDLTHMEAPWRSARHGVPDGERGNAFIAKESLAEDYGSL